MTVTMRELFAKPVDRPIEGVIKADDEARLRLELEEYVITREVEKQLGLFLEAYTKTKTANGAWISGFFGSGKSHLLKMLALVLENRVIDGVPALDIFLEKTGDNEILRADLKLAAGIPSSSILFNIDQKADVISKGQVDALLSVFQKVFDETCGYYGKQGYIAQFERDLDARGQYEAFKSAYQDIAGKPWERGREQALLEGKSIAAAYARASGADAQEAAGIVGKYRADHKVSIEDFANQVKAYIDRQKAGFRLNFFVDEVGQYIADNTKLMTNLQTVAESLNTKCGGRAWIVVTAQQELKAVIGEVTKSQANDFSKIQARFANRLPLTSANVDEVIQKRLLLKKEEWTAPLAELYEAQVNSLRTLFDFADGSIHFKNFKDREHFIQSYPFIPYQYELFQMAIQSLSDHNAFEGRHSSVGERSMLGVFQDVAIHIAGNKLGDLAPFDLMFEGIRRALKSSVQQSIQRGERNLADDFAVRVLKALFLVKYVRPFKASVRNISILLMQRFDEDLTALRKRVEAALTRLEQETYIQRNGDLYEFLTDEEQDIEQEIKNVTIDATEIAEEVEKIVFDTIIKNRKLRHEDTGNDYAYARKIDDRLSGRDYELAINVLTPFSEKSGNAAAVRMESMNRDELAILLSPDERLLGDLLSFKKTEKYVRQNRVTDQPTIERIVSDKAQHNVTRHRDLATRLKTLIGQAQLFVRGEELDIRGEDAQHRIIKAFQILVDKVHVSLGMLRGVSYSEADIGKYLKQAQDGLFGSGAADLTEAEQEVLNVVQANSRQGIRTTVKAALEKFERKPFGWPYAAVLGTIASLAGRGKIEARSDANVLEGGELEKALRNTQAQANTLLEPQADFSPAQVRQLKDFYAEFFGGQPASSDGKLLGKETADEMQKIASELREHLALKASYPFIVALEPMQEAVKAATGRAAGWYLTEFGADKDRLLDLKEDVLDPIRKFLNGPQRAIFDEARSFLTSQQANLAYVESDAAATISDTLDRPSVFKDGGLLQLRGALDALKSAIEAKLKDERGKAQAQVTSARSRLQALEEFGRLAEVDKTGVFKQLDAAAETIDQASLIAVIRDRVNSFATVIFPRLLSEVVVRANAGAGVGGAEGPAAGNGPAVTAAPSGDSEPARPQPRFIPGSAIRVSFAKAFLASEDDVETYLNSMREALLAEIRSGNRITV